MALSADDHVSFSLLDRLMDERPEHDRMATGTMPERLRYLRDSIRRDMESLLNMRRRCLSIPEHLTEVRDSVLNFGIPDFSGANLASEDQREAFRRTIEDAVTSFEPRFHSVAVELLTNADQLDRTLRFRVEAYVQVSPDSEPQIVFDSVLEPVTSSVAVTSGTAHG